MDLIDKLLSYNNSIFSFDYYRIKNLDNSMIVFHILSKSMDSIQMSISIL